MPLTDIKIDLQLSATILFAIAVVHTFLTGSIHRAASRFRPGSIAENVLHFLGEVEVVFGLWGGLLMLIWALYGGLGSAAHYVDSLSFTEAVFVFVIMAMTATRPILDGARMAIGAVARLLPLSEPASFYCAALIAGPCLGSLITEPAAMTVTALLLRERYFERVMTAKFRYATLGLLFVNVSIGGTLTHFAAPPVLMVSGPWGWGTAFMFMNFGWKALLSVSLGTVATAFVFRRELEGMAAVPQARATQKSPMWMIGSHILFVALVILTGHSPGFFVGCFLFFLGWCEVTNEYQDELKLRESLLVGFFLGGLVLLGSFQDWWLRPLIGGMGDTALFWGATALTAITDNAALTYLGTLVPNLSDSARLALVGGAVTGGGLTVIANAPNPAGYSILGETFGEKGIQPLGLLLGALPYTLLAALFLI